MRKIFKQATSVALAAAMVLSVSPVASAANDQTGTITPGLDFEGYVNKSVYDITVPTVTDADFKFVADPQGLLNVADSTIYTGPAGSVYFKTTDASDDGSTPATYTDKSKALTIINNSSYGVDVDLTVTVDTAKGGASNLSLVGKDALADAKTPSLYLGLISKQGADSGSPAPGAPGATEDITTVEATTKANTASLAAVAEGENGYKLFSMTADEYTAETDADAKAGYSTTASPSGYHYKYGLSTTYDAATNGDKVSYVLEGACDTTADWSNVDTSKVEIKLVWSVAKTPDVQPATSAYVILHEGAFWCCSGTEATDGFDADAAFTNVTVNGVALADCEATEGFGNNYLVITWAQCEAAGGDALGVKNPDDKLTWNIQYTCDGVNYACTYTAE